MPLDYLFAGVGPSFWGGSTIWGAVELRRLLFPGFLPFGGLAGQIISATLDAIILLFVIGWLKRAAWLRNGTACASLNALLCLGKPRHRVSGAAS
jgi:hypothetical protein